MKQIYIIITALILLLIVSNWPTIKTNWIVFLTVYRGILSTNRFWWQVSDFFPDKTGINLYKQFKKRYGAFANTSIMGKDVILVTDVKYIKQILDGSPDTFGVGKLKFDFFKSFMEFNVGVSEGCPWQRRRKYNEKVLDTDRIHQYGSIFNQKIDSIFANSSLNSFKDFADLGKKVSCQIVFGLDPFQPIFDIFKKANSLKPLLSSEYRIDTSTKDKYFNYLEKAMENPKPGTLMALASSKCLTKEEIKHQIPHWIFPSNGIVSVALPRLLILLYSHPKVLNKLKLELKKFDGTNFNSMTYTRAIILEMFRLNNPVNSTFRTLLKDTKLGSRSFKKGTQFFILNNPVLRETKFKNPNSFEPNRWIKDPFLEDSYYSIMFNQGPQRCPGKELAILILVSCLNSFLKYNRDKYIQPKIDTFYVPQMINPYRIRIRNI